jgi:hypothetical protein
MVLDNGMTLCIHCHQDIHKQDGCKTSDIIKECNTDN